MWLYLQQLNKVNRVEFIVDDHVLYQTEDHILKGISPDHVNKQTLMQSLKSAGGLTRRRNYGDIQQTIHIILTLSFVDVSTSLEKSIGTKDISINQHRFSSKSIVMSANKDFDKKILIFKITKF